VGEELSPPPCQPWQVPARLHDKAVMLGTADHDTSTRASLSWLLRAPTTSLSGWRESDACQSAPLEGVAPYQDQCSTGSQGAAWQQCHGRRRRPRHPCQYRRQGACTKDEPPGGTPIRLTPVGGRGESTHTANPKISGYTSHLSHREQSPEAGEGERGREVSGGGWFLYASSVESLCDSGRFGEF